MIRQIANKISNWFYLARYVVVLYFILIEYWKWIVFVLLIIGTGFWFVL